MAKPRKAAPVTTPDAPITDEAAPVTTPDAPITDEAAPVTTPDAPAMVKIRMKTTSAGPNADDRWNKGQIRTVARAESDALTSSNMADLL